MTRPAHPDDLYRLAVPFDPRLSPDGRSVAFTVKRSAVGRDGYRHAIWLAPTDGSADARRLTIGARTDRHPRFSPDGRALAFISDRRVLVEEEPDRPREAKDRQDCDQVHLLPLDGGEARRLTDLPRGVEGFAWSPDGTQLAVLTSSLGATSAEDERRRGRPAKPKPGETPLSDYRYIDRLGYQYNGAGFVDDRESHLWLVDVASGTARALVSGPSAESGPAWSPDGTRIAFAANRRRDPDLHWRSGIYVVDVATGALTTIAGGADATFTNPAWTRDGTAILALGERFPRSGYRTSIWRFAADGSDAGAGGGTDLLAGSELKPDAAMNSDVTIGGEPAIAAAADGIHVLFTAPVDGSMELWRVAIAGGGTPERLTTDRHYLAGWDARPAAKGKGDVVVAIRSAATAFPEVIVLDVPARGAASAPRTITGLNDELAAELALVEPLERRWQSDGLEIQGWLLPGGPGARPLVLEIHGGPHTLYGWSPMLEWQVLAGAGISVLASNPRGSEGYGEAFNRANLGDWGDGPMADVVAGVDQAIADGLADPDRLGVTGGSYGGYLTNWIVGKTRPVQGRRHLPLRRRHADAVPHGGHLGRRVGADRVRTQSLGGRGLLPLDLAAVAGRERPHAAAHPAQRARPADDGGPGRGAVHGAPVAPATRAVHARPRREPRAHARRRPVPAGREPRPGPRLVRPLPGQGLPTAAPGAAEPRRTVS